MNASLYIALFVVIGFIKQFWLIDYVNILSFLNNFFDRFSVVEKNGKNTSHWFFVFLNLDLSHFF